MCEGIGTALAIAIWCLLVCVCVCVCVSIIEGLKISRPGLIDLVSSLLSCNTGGSSLSLSVLTTHTCVPKDRLRLCNIRLVKDFFFVFE